MQDKHRIKNSKFALNSYKSFDWKNLLNLLGMCYKSSYFKNPTNSKTSESNGSTE